MKWIPHRPEGDALATWVIYDRPSDYPSTFVARLWLVEGHSTEPMPTDHMFACSYIEVIRDGLRRAGLVCFPRKDNDDPAILETWM